MIPLQGIQQRFLNFKCFFEMVPLESAFVGHCSFTAYLLQHIHVYVGISPKLRLNMIYARCYSNALSAFDERERLQFTDTHCLK